MWLRVQSEKDRYKAGARELVAENQCLRKCEVEGRGDVMYFEAVLNFYFKKFGILFVFQFEIIILYIKDYT